MYTENTPIIGGMPGAPADHVARIILMRPTGEYTEQDLRTIIIPAYYRICLEVSIDPVLAIAQMLHETGNLTSFWAARPRRNPAGIGVTGQVQPAQPPDTAAWAFDPTDQLWRFGVSFATWEQDAIPAQIGRLLAYALPRGSETDLQRTWIERGLKYRPLPDRMRGSAPTLKQLGKVHNPTGNGWASPGTEYGARIAATANRLVQGAAL